MASAVATPLEKQFSTIAGIDSDDVDQRPGHHADHAPVLARPQHRRGGAGRAIGDRHRGAAAAADDARAAVVPQGQPGRLPDPFFALTSDTLPLSTVDEYAETISRSAFRRSTAWRRCRSSAAEIRGTRPARPECARRARHRHQRGRAGGRAARTSTCRPERSTARTRRLRRAGERPAHRTPQASAADRRRTATARRCASASSGG